MRRLLGQILGLGMIALLTSCGKDIDIFEPVELETGDINLFFQAVKSEPMQYEWEASEELVVILPSKGRLIIPAYAFTYENGQVVSGMVQTNITEITEKGNLLGNKQTTTADGMLVDAISTIRIEVNQNGEALQLDTGKFIRIQVVGENQSHLLKVFSGNDSEGFVNWMEVQNDEFPIRQTEIFDPEEGYLEGIEFPSFSLGWVRCGSFLDEAYGTGDASVCVTLPNGFSSKNTAAFLVFRNFDTVIPLDEFTTSGTPMACGLDFLAGYWADVVTISQAGEEGELFFGWEFVNISENLTINIVPEKANLSDIMLALEGL
jgi:hypothetical protein